MTPSENDITRSHNFNKKIFPHKTAIAHFGWNLFLVGVFRRSRSQKNVSKKLTGKRDKNLCVTK